VNLQGTEVNRRAMRRPENFIAEFQGEVTLSNKLEIPQKSVKRDAGTRSGINTALKMRIATDATRTEKWEAKSLECYIHLWAKGS
jgi:hypothetical protein